MAQWFRLPAMRDAWPLADGRRTVLVRVMPTPGLGDFWIDLPPHPDSSHGLVRRRVARDLREERRLRQNSA